MYSQHEHIFYVRFMVCCPLKTISNYMHYSLNGEIETVLIYRCPLIDSDLLYTGGPSRQV
jgi:hypothetical protein